jgi:hypothetical protein
LTLILDGGQKSFLIAISKLTIRSPMSGGGRGGLFGDFTCILDLDFMLKSCSSPAKCTFQPKSRSNLSKDSIAFFFVVASFGIGMNFADSPKTIFVAGGRDLPGVRSWNVRFEGDEK